MKVGILSFAHMHAASYALCLQAIPKVDFVGIYDDDLERGQSMAERYGVPFFAEAQALLDQGLDGVIVCSENAKHLGFVELAAGQTKAILCEKPITTTLEDARAMISLCAERGSRLQIAFPVRFSPPIVRLKELLDEGVLGRLFSIKCTNHGSMPGGWFVDKALAGGGAVIDHTVHVIDLLRWFFGVEVTEVYAEVAEGLLHPDLGIDDAGLLSFKLGNGLYGTLDTSWSRPKSYPTWGDVKLEIIGENGYVRVDAFKQHLTVSSDALNRTYWVPWGSNVDMGLVKDFVAMIREGREPFITGKDGLMALQVALAAYQSAMMGKPISLPPEEP
jgi:predicted dehydrogenase